MLGMEGERRVRVPLVLAAVLLDIVGIVWILQGVGILKGSFMTDSAFWAWMGGLCVAAAIPLLVLGLRRR